MSRLGLESEGIRWYRAVQEGKGRGVGTFEAGAEVGQGARSAGRIGRGGECAEAIVSSGPVGREEG